MTMATGAHLTVTTSARPSIFEILSHEGFSNALKPAVFHVVKVIASYKPESQFSVAYRYFDEIYLAFDALVQWHYVLTRGATFSEAFYGLERKLISPAQKLSRIRLSYFLSVIIPYISSKLEKAFKDHQENSEDVPRSIEFESIAKRSFFKNYPLIKAYIKIANMFYLLAYTFGRSQHHSLIFKILSMTLGYTTEARTQFVESKRAELWDFANWRDPKKLPKLIFRALGESIFLVVELGTFFMQFLEWWYNDEKKARIATTTSASLVPAPQTISKEKGTVQNFVKTNPVDVNKCPVCLDVIRNPTVVSVSGVAYCYGCIFASLKRENKCPLTRLPCNASHLVRIYS